MKTAMTTLYRAEDSSNIERLIRGIYARRNLKLWEPDKHDGNKTFLAIGQYGYVLHEGHKTPGEAERYVLDYYFQRQHLIEP